MVPWTRFPAMFWFQAVTADLLFALILTVLGLWLFSAPVRVAAKGQALTHASASYLGERSVMQFLATIQVKVRFDVPGQADVTTYIYPNRDVDLTGRSRVPISYSTAHPAEAYYAGPGGDEYDFSTGFLYPVTGLVVTGFGLFFVGLALNNQRRIISRTRRAVGNGPQLTIRAEPGQSGQMVVIVSRQGFPWDYSWTALPSETPVSRGDRFLWNLWRRWLGQARLAAPRPWSGPGQADGEVRPHRRITLRTADQLYLPKSRAEPVLGPGTSPEGADGGADDLRRAHTQLLAAYADVLNRVRMLPWFIRPPGKGDQFPQNGGLRIFLCWRAVVRMHAESHVRRQLRELGNAYVRRQFATAEPSGLADLAGQCKALRESLSNGRKIASVLVILTVLIPLIPVAIKTNPVQIGTLLTAILGYLLLAIIFTPGIAVLTGYGDAFRSKRRLFGGDRPGEAAGQAPPSIYALEDQVFGLIGQPKRPQRAVDLWACAIVLLIWGGGGALTLFALRTQPVGLGVWMIYGLSVGLPLLALGRAAWRRRDAER
jgi:hypothetical protein